MSTRDPERGGPLGAVVTAARSALWPVPVLAIVLAVGLGIGLPQVDRTLLGSGHSLSFVFSGGPAAARSILSAIATSLISVTALVFSLTVVALQLSSSQYTPRLLQTFSTDRLVQLTLAQLVLTFVYALTVLRTVRSQSEALGLKTFVPGAAITVAYLLTLGSAVAVVLFLGHLSRSLRVETLLRDVHNEAQSTLARQQGDGDRDDSDDSGDTDADGDADGWPVGQALLEASSSGFLVAVEERVLVDAAREAGVRLRLLARIGDDVIAGTPVACAAPVPGDDALAALRRTVGGAVVLRYERQASRDPIYSLRKIVDIVVRSLSPGINDPTTAVHGLSHASALLGTLLDRPAGPGRHRDGDGQLRLVVPQWRPADLLHLAVEEPVQFSDGQPAVLRRLAGLLREVAWRVPGGVLDAELTRYTERVAQLAADSTDVPAAEIAEWRRRVVDARAGRWPTGLG